MLSRSRGLRFALLCMLVGASVAGPSLSGERCAHAQEEEEEESDDEGGDEGGGGKGEGGDEGDGEGDEEEADAKDQPLVTSGGLFTLKTYPVREISRPLSMTEKILQLRASLGTDISSKGAFGTYGLSIEAVYGLKDNMAFIAGLTNAYNFNQFGVYAGIEGSLAYDLLNFRIAANVHRNAIPRYAVFCNPPSQPNEMPVGGAGGTCTNPMATQDNQPSGEYKSGDIKFSIDLGFPFRYAIRPEIAIVALQTLMTIDFNSVEADTVQVIPRQNAPPGAPPTDTILRGNSAKPDLNPSLGIATNPVPPLSVVIFAQLRIPDFDVSAGEFQVPVTGRVQFSPNQKYDVGLEFTLLNVKPPEGQSPIDNRFLALFFQTRVGR